MRERTIFPKLKLFKKTVTEHFLVALRTIYKNHPIYTYEEQPELTLIHIEPTYANVTFEGKQPQMHIKTGSYEFTLQDTLGGNLYGDAKNALGVTAGFRSLKGINATMTISVKAYAEEEAEDIADELAMLGVYAAHHMFTQVGINIRGSSVSDTNKTDAQNDIYQTIVSFLVEVPWEFAQYTEKEAAILHPETELESTPAGDYHPPGVDVYDA